MKIFFPLLLMLAVAPMPVNAAFTDFNSLVLGTVYSAGDTFQSDDLSFSTVDFIFTDEFTRVQDFLHAGGTGLELSILGGLNFILPVGTQQISMRYELSDPSHGLAINGITTPIGTKFSQLDGTFVDGVLISTILNPGQGEQGVLTLDGPINSFVIGGVELWIDDVSITVVPEPSTAALLIVASIPLFARRRTRRV